MSSTRRLGVVGQITGTVLGAGFLARRVWRLILWVMCMWWMWFLGLGVVDVFGPDEVGAGGCDPWM